MRCGLTTEAPVAQSRSVWSSYRRGYSRSTWYENSKISPALMRHLKEKFQEEVGVSVHWIYRKMSSPPQDHIGSYYWPEEEILDFYTAPSSKSKISTWHPRQKDFPFPQNFETICQERIVEERGDRCMTIALQTMHLSARSLHDAHLPTITCGRYFLITGHLMSFAGYYCNINILFTISRSLYRLASYKANKRYLTTWPTILLWTGVLVCYGRKSWNNLL